ncbi:conserved hypothetical protein [Xenorhabdus nematophila F1]|nr:conserved hypothetical protein [Xenorhabdus nematophila F1]
MESPLDAVLRKNDMLIKIRKTTFKESANEKGIFIHTCTISFVNQRRFYC